MTGQDCGEASEGADMATGVEGLAQGIVDGASIPAVSKVGPNLRVTVPTGPVGVVGDVVTFPGPTATGTWSVGSLRVSAASLPVITQTSIGVTVTVAGPPGGPMRVQIADSRVSAQ